MCSASSARTQSLPLRLKVASGQAIIAKRWKRKDVNMSVKGELLEPGPVSNPISLQKQPLWLETEVGRDHTHTLSLSLCQGVSPIPPF